MLRRIQILWVLSTLALCLQAQHFQDKDEDKAKEAKPPALLQVSGIVTNQDGHGLQHIEVTIVAAKLGEKKTPTNASGAYTFELAPGNYTLTAKSSKGKSRSVQVEVKPGKSKLPPLILDVEP